MKVSILCGRAGSLWTRILRGVREARDAGHRVILLVPEQFTLQAEQDLIRDLNLKGLLDIDVLSPKRLQTRVREYAGGSGRKELNLRGRTMAVSRLLSEYEDVLEYYARSAGRPGTARELNDAIAELQEAGVTPEQLEEMAEQTGADGERAKLKDIAMIWKAYNALILPAFGDEDCMQRETLQKLVTSGVLKDTCVWIYGFETVRNYLNELIVKMTETACLVTLTMIADRPEAPDGRMFSAQRKSIACLGKMLEEAGHHAETTWVGNASIGREPALAYLERNLFADRKEKPWQQETGNISVFRAANPYAEATEAVKTLLEWHNAGIPWKRMAIAVPEGSGTADALAAALSVSDVPHYMTRRKAVTSHGISRMLTGSLRAATGGYQSQDVIRVVRSGFTVLTEDEALILEEYAAGYGIDRKKWQKPFAYGDNATEAETVRLKLIPELERLHDELKASGNTAASVEAIVRYMERQGVYALLTEREEKLLEHGMLTEAVENRQVWKSLMELLDQLWNLLGEKRIPMKELASLIAGGLEQTEVSAVPSVADSVLIGAPGHMLAGRTDALICMGMEESILALNGSGAFSDRERKRLEERLGKPVGLGNDLKVSLKKSDYYRTLTLPTRFLKMTCSLSGADGKSVSPASLLNETCNLFPLAENEGGVMEDGRFDTPCSPQLALEGLAVRLGEMRDGDLEDLPAEWKLALRCLWNDGSWHERLLRLLREMAPDDEQERISQRLAQMLYQQDSVSITRLEGFAACPFKHFIDYGLKPVERKTFEFENNERGSFYHDALDRYLRIAETNEKWPDLTYEDTQSIMDGILPGLTAEWEGGPLREDAMGEWTGDVTIRQVRGAARILTLYAQNSSFRTYATEQSFGDDNGLPALILEPQDGRRIALRGRIDRIDLFEEQGMRVLRVVDNKSTQKELNPALIQSGEQLQLLLYLKAALAGIPGTVPGGALYFPVMDPDVDPGQDTMQEADLERIKKLRMKGVVLADETVVHAMDTENPYSIGKVFTQKGEIAKSADWALDAGTLQNLMDAAQHKAEELCTGIRQGRIEISPSVKKEQPTCRYCNYRSVCRVRDNRMRDIDEKIGFADVASEGKIGYNEST